MADVPLLIRAKHSVVRVPSTHMCLFPQQRLSLIVGKHLKIRVGTGTIFRYSSKKAFNSPYLDQDTKKRLGIDEWSPEEVPANGPLLTSFIGKPAASIQDTWSATFRAKRLHTIRDPFENIYVGLFNHLNTIDPKSNQRSYATTAPTIR